VRRLLARLTLARWTRSPSQHPQVERLFAVAPAATVCAALAQRWSPAVARSWPDTLARHGIKARLMPEESFFSQALTTALEERCARTPERRNDMKTESRAELTLRRNCPGRGARPWCLPRQRLLRTEGRLTFSTSSRR